MPEGQMGLNNNTMKTNKELERLHKIHQLIKTSKTGTPKEFAKKLNLSESQLYNILNRLKVQRFPITYSKNQKTYLYTEYCELKIHYSVELLTENEKVKISGGSKNSSRTPRQLECRSLY